MLREFKIDDLTEIKINISTNPDNHSLSITIQELFLKGRKKEKQKTKQLSPS